MSILAISNFNFHGVTLKPVEREGDLWFSSADLAKALGYKKTDAVTQIYSRYSDEFGANMSTTLRERVVRKTGSVEMLVRFFSLRGAHLVAMFATTTKAKEFRRWVLDILDREVEQGNVNPAFDFEMHSKNMTVARKHFKFIYEAWCHQLEPALRAINSPVAAELVAPLKSLGSLTYGVHLGLERAEKSKRIH